MTKIPANYIALAGLIAVLGLATMDDFVGLLLVDVFSVFIPIIASMR